MQLKIPPKDAIGILNGIIKDGLELYSPLTLGDSENYWAPHSYADNPPDADLSVRITKNNDATVAKLKEWYKKAKLDLEGTFQDFTSIYRFSRWIEKLIVELASKEAYSVKQNEALLRALDVLAEYSETLSKDLVTPVFYISQKSQLCFYAYICQLQPDSNESELCKFLFENYSFNEFIEMAVISEKLFGVSEEDYDQKSRDKIKNAMVGVNEKTTGNFGFPIIKRQKTMLALTLPSHLVKS